MDKVYQKYFRPRDKDKVKEVFNNILGESTPPTGSDLLSSIEVVKDYKDPETGKYHCIKRKRQALFYDNPNKPELIICPVAFTSTGGIDKAYDNVAAVTCDTVGDILTKKMDTMGSTILHEYTHFTKLVVPPLASATEDHENKLHQLHVIAKTGLAVENAESYTQFANEAFWTIKCARWFDAADPYAESSSEEDCS
ncbi:hypothetical protein N7510_010904 [Penicillium lagena]|uniref:uncharacterized protein n=1 Tax=Penicillium lagena TaxID=94218 RepID=UPI0025422C9B|nr:uncharacterized protein N7510_010904 [Penicillium lagena]KAJ5601370.1 hypothetical protein N7510_010904 [Penicillium lagena]